jgi:hypothetical protein
LKLQVLYQRVWHNARRLDSSGAPLWELPVSHVFTYQQEHCSYNLENTFIICYPHVILSVIVLLQSCLMCEWKDAYWTQVVMMAKILGTGDGNRSVGWIYLVSCGSLPLGLPKWGREYTAEMMGIKSKHFNWLFIRICYWKHKG